MQQKKVGFTLIELMVVVAVIAILATLSVTSFSAAIKRTRNAGRQADIQAVAKAMETCYDVSSATYTGLSVQTGGNTTCAAGGVNTADGFKNIVKNLNEAGCLNEQIISDMAQDFPYTATCQENAPQAFILCAKLEKVANWGSVGNWLGVTAPGLSATNLNTNPCVDGGEACWFCVQNQQ